MTLGEKLVMLRQRTGFVQKAWCEDFNKKYPRQKVNRAQYSNWELNMRTMTIHHLKLVVEYYQRFHLTADDLIFDDKVPPILKQKRPKTSHIK